MNDWSVVELGRLLTHARRTVPHYQGLIAANEVTQHDALKVLRSLPLLTREQVRAEKPRLWSTVGDPYAWKTVRTSGTTGIPIEVAVDETAQLAELASMARQIDACMANGDWREHLVMHLTLHWAANSRTAPSPWSSRSHLVKWNLSRVWQQSDERFLECLKKINGHIITAMPSVAAVLLNRVRRSGRIQPQMIVLSGEQVDDDLRRRISAVFGCPSTCLYTLAEMGIAANGCLATSGYHVNDTDVFLEVVDERGTDVGPDEAGDVVITSLTNRAMPLIRYMTGDRGQWVSRPCDCPQPGRLFRLQTTRSLDVVAESPTGRRITQLDVAKLFAQLDVDATRLAQNGPTIIVEYRANTDLGTVPATAITAAVRGMLGPDTHVLLRRVTELRPPYALKRSATVGLVPPKLPQPQEIVTWSRRRLADEPGVVAAVLTGSALDPSGTSRFSDVDMAVLVDHDPDDQRWRKLAVAMHRHLPGLRVNVTTAQALTGSPLITCRLLAERYPILGKLESGGVEWPSQNDLSKEAVFWAQDARAVLWTMVTAADRSRVDPLREAWLAAKYGLDALRYHFLCQGNRVTQAHQVLQMALKQCVTSAPGIQAAFDVAREHQPPPPTRSSASDQYLADALSIIEWVRDNLPTGDRLTDVRNPHLYE